MFHPSDLVANRIEPLIKTFEYPEHLNKNKSMIQGSFVEAPPLDISVRPQEEEYCFNGDNLLGPVLIPWYKNHGLNHSQ